MNELIELIAARVAELRARYQERHAKLMQLARMDETQAEPNISSAGWHAPVAGWVHWETGEVYDKGQFIQQPRDDWYCSVPNEPYPIKKHRMLVPVADQLTFREAIRNYASVGFGKCWVNASGVAVCYAYLEGYEPVIAVAQRWCDEQEAKIRETEKALKGAAPEGTQTIEATICSMKSWETGYDTVIKTLLRMDNGATLYGTLPGSIAGLLRVAGHEPKIGDRITMTANFELAKDDVTHAFYKRPRKAMLLVDDNQRSA